MATILAREVALYLQIEDVVFIKFIINEYHRVGLPRDLFQQRLSFFSKVVYNFNVYKTDLTGIYSCCLPRTCNKYISDSRLNRCESGYFITCNIFIISSLDTPEVE